MHPAFFDTTWQSLTTRCSEAYSNNLSGSLPPELGNLSSLQVMCVRTALRRDAQTAPRVSVVQRGVDSCTNR